MKHDLLLHLFRFVVPNGVCGVKFYFSPVIEGLQLMEVVVDVGYPRKNMTKTAKLQQLLSTVVYCFHPKALIHWGLAKGRNPERGKYGRSTSHCCQPITCFTTEPGERVDESVLRDHESLHHPEAAGWWHVRQRADGEKQRVRGAGSYKEVRLVLHFCP